MNKGLEVSEARWLFNIGADKIDVIVHPQSIVHSLVQFEDGSMKAQLGLPDMKLPIQYALGYPNRLKSTFKRFDFSEYPILNFEQPDTKTFRNLALAFQSLETGGNAPCVLNAANEVAVDAFLNDRISFLGIPEVISECLDKASIVKDPGYADYVASDAETRKLAVEIINKTKL